MPIAVVLPAPFGPSSAKKSPSSTSRSMPFSAWTPFLYVLVSLRSDRAFMEASAVTRGERSVMRARRSSARNVGCRRRPCAVRRPRAVATAPCAVASTGSVRTARAGTAPRNSAQAQASRARASAQRRPACSQNVAWRGPARPHQPRPRGEPERARRASVPTRRRFDLGRTPRARSATTTARPRPGCRATPRLSSTNADSGRDRRLDHARGPRVGIPVRHGLQTPVGCGRHPAAELEQRERAVRQHVPGPPRRQRQSASGRSSSRQREAWVFVATGSSASSRNSRLRSAMSRRTTGFSRLPCEGQVGTGSREALQFEP